MRRYGRQQKPVGGTGVLAVLFALAALAGVDTARAKACGGVHEAQAGETLQSIGAQYYDTAEKWTALYYANANLVDTMTSELESGTEIKVPCLGGDEEGAQVSTDRTRPMEQAELNLLTGGNYAPFTSQDLPANGMITEVVQVAFAQAPQPVTFSISWESDWSRHLDPLLVDHEYDAGFPWLKPNCEDTPDNSRCKNFHFSDPLVEMLVQLFVRADEPLSFAQDSDIHGATLCRPKGYYTHDLDRPGRRWLSEGKIELVRAKTPKACFEQLASGEVDGVTINEFLGRRTVHDLGLKDKVVALDRPISVQGLHLIVPKTAPRATTFLYRFNAGVAKLKKAERYQAIVKRHMGAHWDRLAQGGG
jgi:polar amino acid transport system substrate-binding protein